MPKACEPQQSPILDQEKQQPRHPWCVEHMLDHSIIKAKTEASAAIEVIASITGRCHAPIATLVVQINNRQANLQHTIEALASIRELCLACDGKLLWEAEQEAEIPCRQTKESEIASPIISSNNILTRREIELLTLAAQGKTREQIAKLLSIKSDTVKKHFDKILRTLNASNKTHAVSIAAALGVITLCLEGVQRIPSDDIPQKGSSNEKDFTQRGNIYNKT